ncbi:hypothetical protein WA026_002369 [Henosepilachna vigintioctopunctata]|uniref:Uncharacterized protein n=1 Tax=Henosepilachna vigintioctopunctata TaxID=420089 RepID=A0AAW1TR62_9CUCU
MPGNQVQPKHMQQTVASYPSDPHAVPVPSTVTSASVVSDLLDRVPESRSTSLSILSQDDLISPPIPETLTIVTMDKSAPANMSVPSTNKECIPLTYIQELPKAKTQNRRKSGKKSIIRTEFL